jgi:hypothetical protein
VGAAGSEPATDGLQEREKVHLRASTSVFVLNVRLKRHVSDGRFRFGLAGVDPCQAGVEHGAMGFAQGQARHRHRGNGVGLGLRGVGVTDSCRRGTRSCRPASCRSWPVIRVVSSTGDAPFAALPASSSASTYERSFRLNASARPCRTHALDQLAQIVNGGHGRSCCFQRGPVTAGRRLGPAARDSIASLATAVKMLRFISCG